MKILALLADFANGIFATLLAGYITGTDPSWHFIVGIVFAVFPDLDAFPELWQRGTVAASATHTHDHREALHFPVIFIMAGICLIFFSQFWGLLFIFATILHFINDLYGTGWGIPLLWPLTSRRYKFFSRKANLLKTILIEKNLWKNLPDPERRLRFVMSWSREELSTYIRTYGIEDWVERYYLRINWVSGIEYALFMLALGLLLVSL